MILQGVMVRNAVRSMKDVVLMATTLHLAVVKTRLHVHLLMILRITHSVCCHGKCYPEGTVCCRFQAFPVVVRLLRQTCSKLRPVSPDIACIRPIICPLLAFERSITNCASC